MAFNVRKGVLDSYLNRSGYVSCIRIAGVPILPPLITEERRKEIQDDRNKAMMIEKCLKCKRNSTDSGVMTGSYTDDGRITNWQSQNYPHQISEPYMCDVDNNTIVDLLADLSNSCQIENVDDNFVKHAIADDEFKRFLCSNIAKALRESSESVTPKSDRCVSSETSCPEDLDFIGVDHSDNRGGREIFMKDNFFSLPLDSENSNEKHHTGWDEYRTKDMLDVSVCKSLSLISPRFGTDVCIYEVENELSQMSLDDKCNEVVKPDIPPLVRRNSYVLESPSPALLEHMKNQQPKLSVQDLNIESTRSIDNVKNVNTRTVRKPRKLWNHVEQKAFLEKCKTLHSPLLNSNFVKRSVSFPSLQESNLNCSVQRSLSTDCILTLIQYNHNDFSMQDFGVKDKVHCSGQTINGLRHDSVLILNETCNNNVGDHQQINDHLCSPESAEQNFPYYKHGLDLRMNPKALENGAGLLVDKQFREVDPRRESLPPSTTRSDDGYSICSSISLNKFLPAQKEHFSSPPSTAEDLSQLFNQLKIQHERQLQELLKRQEEEQNILSTYQSHSPNLSRNNSSVQNDSHRKSLCNRELFPEKPSEKYSEKENKAATKICAYARGYLTRRLLHTDRVQQIIETIRESLLCALNLRAEPALKPTDLDLNTRLIQQLTSACYELHDMFFLPVTQRMTIIATDREIKRKKMSRPSSASISSATRRSIHRKQQSVDPKTIQKLPKTTPRARARSCSSGSSYSVASTGLSASSVALKRCASSINTRQPWR